MDNIIFLIVFVICMAVYVAITIYMTCKINDMNERVDHLSISQTDIIDKLIATCRSYEEEIQEMYKKEKQDSKVKPLTMSDAIEQTVQENVEQIERYTEEVIKKAPTLTREEINDYIAGINQWYGYFALTNTKLNDCLHYLIPLSIEKAKDSRS